MRISSKIEKRIEALSASEEFKRLMLDILRIEDDGVYRFKGEYEKLINEYIDGSSKRGDGND